MEKLEHFLNMQTQTYPGVGYIIRGVERVAVLSNIYQEYKRDCTTLVAYIK